ncbi:hypothetical protein GGE24_003644 [Bradyrhizobium centrosematis]|nr:hypothetical protein [Bradyrhizobium centrosematis]MCS3774305.1 hypothetical protein [Bradyrhizobium centrosematis]
MLIRLPTIWVYRQRPLSSTHLFHARKVGGSLAEEREFSSPSARALNANQNQVLGFVGKPGIVVGIFSSAASVPKRAKSSYFYMD